MLYWIAKPIANIAFRVYFRQVYFSNVQNLPKDKPVILASNHPTAFVEPCIVASFQDRPLNFLARGDFFASPFLAWVLRQFHIIPIYRLQDGGYEKLKDNFSSFRECYAAFAQNKVVLIMAEGGTVHEKRLRPLKKGTARLAFGALEQQPDLDLHIVPMGANYTKAEEFRNIAMLNFAQPIRVQDYAAIHQENKAKAIRLLTKELDQRLRSNVVELEKGEEGWTNFSLTLQQNSWEKTTAKANQKRGSAALLQAQKKWTEKLFQLEEQEKNTLKQAVLDYQNALEQFEVTDLGLLHADSLSFKNRLSYSILYPLRIVGLLVHFIPCYLAKKGAKKLIPDDLTFEIPIKITLGIVFYLLIFLVTIGAFLLTKSWSILLFLVGFILSGIFYLKSNRFFEKIKQAKLFNNLPKNVKTGMLEKRREIIDRMEKN